jgi:hypothetical protein
MKFVYLQREGVGTLIHMGSLYTGEFFQDKKHGKGKMEYATGYEYDGMWKDDQPCMFLFAHPSTHTPTLSLSCGL